MNRYWFSCEDPWWWAGPSKLTACGWDGHVGSCHSRKNTQRCLDAGVRPWNHFRQDFFHCNRDISPFPSAVNNSAPALLFKLSPPKRLQPGSLLQWFLISRDGTQTDVSPQHRELSTSCQCGQFHICCCSFQKEQQAGNGGLGLPQLSQAIPQWVSRGTFNTPAHLTWP